MASGAESIAPAGIESYDWTQEETSGHLNQSHLLVLKDWLPVRGDATPVAESIAPAGIESVDWPLKKPGDIKESIAPAGIESAVDDNARGTCEHGINRTCWY